MSGNGQTSEKKTTASSTQKVSQKAQEEKPVLDKDTLSP